MSVHGRGTFEGADAILGGRRFCFVAEGLRTNEEGANQVERMLREIGVAKVVRVGFPSARCTWTDSSNRWIVTWRSSGRGERHTKLWRFRSRGFGSWKLRMK